MLKISESRTLNGTIEIEKVAVVQLSASIILDSENGGYYNGGVNRTILDVELYRKNITAIRDEIAKFEEAVYGIEDEILANESV